MIEERKIQMRRGIHQNTPLSSVRTLCLYLFGIVGGLMFSAGSCSASAEIPPKPIPEDIAWKIGKPPQPADNSSNRERIALGKSLFFDPRLSGNGTVSCASCHNPALGWSDGLRTGVGINGQVLPRSSPTVINVAYNSQFMWDGRAKSLEDQALGPLRTPQEMSANFEHMKIMLQSLQGYRSMFEKAYPGEPISEQTVAKALAAFERSIISKDARFDKWLKGNRSAITMQEWRGFQVFKSPDKGNCAACHSGPNFTDNGFHNIGIAPGKDGETDEGRFKLRALPSMKGAFKTPTLRDIELTAPYFHDGSAATLEAVVEHYNRGGDANAISKTSGDIRPLNLSASEMKDLVAFMKTLTGASRPVVLPSLPR